MFVLLAEKFRRDVVVSFSCLRSWDLQKLDVKKPKGINIVWKLYDSSLPFFSAYWEGDLRFWIWRMLLVKFSEVTSVNEVTYKRNKVESSSNRNK